MVQPTAPQAASPHPSHLPPPTYAAWGAHAVAQLHLEPFPTHNSFPALQIWDLGGQQNLRPFWGTYFKGTDAVIMVVDSTDRARVGVTKVGSNHHSPWYNGGWNGGTQGGKEVTK